MSEPELQQPASPAPVEPTTGAPPATGRSQRGSLLGGMLAGVRQVGRDVVAVTIGRLLEQPVNEEKRPPDSEQTGQSAPADAATRRVGMLHAVTEQLRGAADSYLAAKLDEIEARVDQKLDGIEVRVDEKIARLHEHLAELRDRELRHRLRLLKITLIFTALVALLSLLYKWVEKFWQLA